MRKRRYFTQPEMEEVWDRWESGESLNSIARGLERGHSAVQGMLSRTGGIRPAPKKRWSPHQIAGWLKRSYPDDASFQLSHETIYLTLYIQARGDLKKELSKYLRRSRAMRRSRRPGPLGR